MYDNKRFLLFFSHYLLINPRIAIDVMADELFFHLVSQLHHSPVNNAQYLIFLEQKQQQQQQQPQQQQIVFVKQPIHVRWWCSG